MSFVSALFASTAVGLVQASSLLGHEQVYHHSR